MIGFTGKLGVFFVESLLMYLFVCVVFIVVCFIVLQLLLLCSYKFRRCSSSESGVNVVIDFWVAVTMMWLLRPPHTFSTCFCLTVMLCDAGCVEITWVNSSMVSSVEELAS